MEKAADPSEIDEQAVGLDGCHMAFHQLPNLEF